MVDANWLDFYEAARVVMAGATWLPTVFARLMRITMMCRAMVVGVSGGQLVMSRDLGSARMMRTTSQHRMRREEQRRKCASQWLHDQAQAVGCWWDRFIYAILRVASNLVNSSSRAAGQLTSPQSQPNSSRPSPDPA